MNRTFFFLIILSTALAAMAQATQPCVVKQYNQKQQKTPLGGVQVTVSNAGTSVSGADGRLMLTFRTMKPGNHVNLISVKKEGYELMNKTAVEQWNISSNGTPFSLVLVRSDYFAQLKGKLRRASNDSYKAKYEQAVRQLERLKKEGKMKEAEYNQKLDELESNYQNQLFNLKNYIDQFARIDLSEVSAEEQRILDMVEDGKIDEAVKAYEALDIRGKLRQARENKNALSEAKARIEEEEAQQKQAIKDLKEKQQREITTLKLAGGKENYDKVARILKENALTDTTDIDAVWEYARFAYFQRDFKEAEKFWHICLNGSKDNLYRQAVLQNSLGNLYKDLHDYTNAEEYLLKALENKNQLFRQNPKANRASLAMSQNNLGNLYRARHDYAKALEYYLQALENEEQLILQNPGAYRADLAMTQQNLGALYRDLHDYAKAEEYYLQALENYEQLFHQNPNAYRAYLALPQKNIGNLYLALHNYAKAEEYYIQALENYTQQFRQNPDAYRADLASTQRILGSLYKDRHDYAKAEEYYLKALENYDQLFHQNPNAYRAHLALPQKNIGNLYLALHDYAKAEEYYIQALENYTQLFRQNPDAYRADLANSYNQLAYVYAHKQDYTKAIETIDRAIALMPENANSYDTKGEISLMKGNEQEALKMWQKVQELDTDFLKTHDSELYKQLKEKGLITE